MKTSSHILLTFGILLLCACNATTDKKKYSPTSVTPPQPPYVNARSVSARNSQPSFAMSSVEARGKSEATDKSGAVVTSPRL